MSLSALLTFGKGEELSLSRAVGESWSDNPPFFRRYHSRLASSGHSLHLPQVVPHESDSRKPAPVASRVVYVKQLWNLRRLCVTSWGTDTRFCF